MGPRQRGPRDLGGARTRRAPRRDPGTDPVYVSGLVDLVLERVNGVPTEDRASMTALGPWYDVCRPGCCENVRAGFKPALAGIAP